MLGGVCVPAVLTQANVRRKKAGTISAGQLGNRVRTNTFIVMNSMMGYQASFRFAALATFLTREPNESLLCTGLGDIFVTMNRIPIFMSEQRLSFTLHKVHPLNSFQANYDLDAIIYEPCRDCTSGQVKVQMLYDRELTVAQNAKRFSGPHDRRQSRSVILSLSDQNFIYSALRNHQMNVPVEGQMGWGIWSYTEITFEVYHGEKYMGFCPAAPAN
ncbi:hypothetical protein T265_01729 [Opisthorchis viverrini]|uniref:Uncharacterized protein n=1 Tax=Opisthorchis viverrini TaxID=6198 RepID=A0A075A8Q8_OPIVI|nr:hypothetical protein T265_01729 [Opisthorchis viverrini]KER32105.1 hypothetical protein T265_01729 [Opisthorchis viverrini]